MVEDSGDVGVVEEALPEEGGAEWEGEEAEEGSEQGGKFWWSHTDMKVCFSWPQLFVDYEMMKSVLVFLSMLHLQIVSAGCSRLLSESRFYSVLIRQIQMYDMISMLIILNEGRILSKVFSKNRATAKCYKPN